MPSNPFLTGGQAADRTWFKSNPNQTFRVREPLPGEFSPAELERQPAHGEPVVFVIATRDPHGRVQRVIRMLKYRLPARRAS